MNPLKRLASYLPPLWQRELKPSAGDNAQSSLGGKRLSTSGDRLVKHLTTGVELAGIRLREVIVRSRGLWRSVYLTSLLLDSLGKKVLAARIFAAGQRIAPQACRALFGRAAAAKLDVIISTGVEAPRGESFAESRVRVIKPFIGPREKGVIHVMFSGVVSTLPQLVDLGTLNAYFRLVLEPSWAGVCDPGFLQYARASCKNVIMVPDPADFEFIDGLAGQLVPVSLGSCDWVDPRVAEPFLGAAKEFDIVMNASWAPWKRHQVLFSAMRQMKSKPKVALIGGSWDGGDLDRIARLARFYGVADYITVFERIPFQKVMEVVCSSRCCVLLSLKEGANRALAESMFCNVPVGLLAENIGGAQKNVVPQTGLVVPERYLAQSLEGLISGRLLFTPRQWALDNISCVASTAVLNLRLRAVAEQEGEAWTRDIVVRSNSPESKYFDPVDEAALAEANAAVVAFFQRRSSLPIPNAVSVKG
ncbi:MAG: glycosyltransferase [Gammaproteobacteria bacterium]|nr:glycosyltransferase [Gammaproteobacteria bacterium]